MKTAVGADYPEDPYAAYRGRYVTLMQRLATAMRNSLRLGGRR